MAAAAASIAGGVASRGAGLLEGFSVKLESKFGTALSDMDRFNKAWDGLNKQLKPATELWNKVTGVFDHFLGVMKGIIAPLALAGGLFFAFLLTGEAGRDIFGAFGAIIGAFADVLTASLLPAILPLIDAAVALLPEWEAIFATDEWRQMMERLGEQLVKLLEVGFEVLIDLMPLVKEALQFVNDFILPTFIATLESLKDWIRVVEGAWIDLKNTVSLRWDAEGSFLPALEHALVGVRRSIGQTIDEWNRLIQTASDPTSILRGEGIKPPWEWDWGAIFGWKEPPKFPGFQMGGVVQETGLAMVHAGEIVVPASGAAGGGVGGVTYNVTIPIQSFLGTEDNIEQLAREIAEILRREAYMAVNTLR